MTNNIMRICVFASASNDLKEIYYKDAQLLGELIAKNGYDLVYGGSHRGLMYASAKSAKQYGSKIIGVMPEKLANLGFTNPEDCEEFYVTKGMRERKAKLDEISDAVIAIAGGYGTLEELSEIIVQKQLNYNNKPIVILNTDGFYDKLIEFFNDIILKGFAHNDTERIYYVAQTPEEALEYINNYVPEKLTDKYIIR